ncbi:hypothetical protein A1Q1_06870 [Trichosporon asahii var. asahii CBS 2479]|uniref:S-adenosylmethionine-dependent methyltransferase n=1 Tax=Trichosporon asahii var. asahii (strain ATCC 90039 / CBS 2479 / JCM 2466 / KCTC 7840 / NBRC 103889/ NCYC 2677 / UAMH 7654) TaxID=1186058 RepID=J5RCC3_TRIAS|nr:hypothetical protein A1Q1_06870 [Trichosporon asahii var. asahii CBS 2479]EJT51873.1 hypothetical protein A1Q1_06870 [Trichosporon asahii var. asahii CBS 2479]
MRGAIPTTLLPQLPRAQYTLSPLCPGDLLGYMSVLKDMYMPPIHGGFTAGDVELDEEDKDADTQPNNRRRSRTLSGGSVDLVPPGLGLEMDGLSLQDTIKERAEDEFSDYSDHSDYEQEGDEPYNDPFEREWAEKWLNGVVRRAQTFLEEAEEDAEVGEYEAILREATAVLAMMAGTSAAGSLTRHLVFPLAPELGPALRAMRPAIMPANADRSPETATFLNKLATSPSSPTVGMSALARRRSSHHSHGSSVGSDGWKGGKRKPAALPVLLHDAPMSDHISVGVQTWGSAILLGREMSLRPADFGLFPRPGQTYPHGGGTRVLELGAGTGLLSILCRKLLDLHAATNALNTSSSEPRTPQTASTLTPTTADAGLVVATDFHPDVLANLRVCVDLNAPPRLPGQEAGPGIEIAKLDWTTFPGYMASGGKEGEEELAPWLDTPFDLVLASDCVYDPTHAQMLRDVAGWVLRLPEGEDQGGTMHILSPIRPTFTPELESIDVAFPTIESYTPLAERRAAAEQGEVTDKEMRGEGLGLKQGLKLGVRGGKRSVRGRKGEGRTDEVAGYWWWEVGWG